MLFSKIKLLYHTIKYLKIKQIYYRVFYFFRNKFVKQNYSRQFKKELVALNWDDYCYSQTSYTGYNHFTFLNKSKKFENKIDWNYSQYGKLWTYNLNYFDFLNQKEIDKSEALIIIKGYIKQHGLLKDGLESYPVSLRGVNWIKFLSKYKINDILVNEVLYSDYIRLTRNLEYHLLGNHILENGFSLLFGAYFFKDNTFYLKAKKILRKELREQILDDGGHFELSPMYHQIILHRLLDCINLIEINFWKHDDFLSFLRQIAERMLSWLMAITYRNGNIPMVNDSAYSIAPSSKELFNYANYLKLVFSEGRLLDCGYRKITRLNYELLMDVGNVGAIYQPAHVHSDTFNFELYVKGKPFIVDRGISTYEKNNLRSEERSTFSHNTVQIGSIEQTNVWGGFRVAERAKIIHLIEHENMITASHSGYKKIGIIHERTFAYNDNQIIIEDDILGKTELKKKAIFHFHPSLGKLSFDTNIIHFKETEVKMEFQGEIHQIETKSYNYNIGFNKRLIASKIIVCFNGTLKTSIVLN